MEHNFEYRQRMLQVHKPNRAISQIWNKINGLVIDDSFEIVYPADSDRVIINAAKDLREYFEISMNIYLRIKPLDANDSQIYESRIFINSFLEKAGTSYNINVCKEGSVIISGSNARAAAQGCYYLEDIMNLNEGPVVEYGTIERESLYSPRMTHSGFGVDMFPDEHLRTIAHSGMDAILVFTKDVNISIHGYLDFNDLIYRAAGYGIDVYAYSYMTSKKHPDEPDAEDYYESLYGNLFAECPDLKGIVFVGESVEFPSKDERTTGHSYKEPREAGDIRPSPGWFPCRDYPQWINLVKKVIRSKNSKADIVFWSYNWGYQPAELRIELIRNLPADVSLLVTYEMFEHFPIKKDVTVVCSDYSIYFEGPGHYFKTEAEEASRRGIKLYTMCNTGGLTWDIGVVYTIPAPYQWKKRFDSLLDSHNKWRLSGLMECHHYGFTPSIISELGKESDWTGGLDFDTHIKAIAVRDFGEQNAEDVIKAYKLFSEGIKHCVPAAVDQYGAARIGSAYPLLFDKMYVIPGKPYDQHGGNTICNPMYNYNMNNLAQLLYETDEYDKMSECYRHGSDILKKALGNVIPAKYDDAYRFYCLGRFIEKAALTVANVKRWVLLKYNLKNGIGDRIQTVSEMKKLAESEIANAKSVIPLVEFDSHLGVEPTMGYMCDKAHLEWKIRVTEEVLRNEITSE